MTTLKDLKKYGAEFGFTEDMKNLGFTIGPNGFWFYRQREVILDVVFFHNTSTGHWTQPSVLMLVDGLLEDYDMKEFPKSFTKNVSFINDVCITENGIEHPWHRWEIRDKNKIQESFRSIIDVMRSSGDNWFRSVSSKKDLWNLLKECVKETPREKEIWDLLNA